MRSAARTLVIGTRGSALALAQSNYVRDRLQAIAAVAPVLQTITTTGDVQLDTPLPEIGGKGVFTQELEAALRAGAIDLAVHSLKDLPTAPVEGIVIAAIPEREDARDALVSRTGLRFADLTAAALVGTSSTRRSAQLRAARADLRVASIRGNVETRIRKCEQGDYDAVVLALAGLNRLGLRARVTEVLPFEIMLPAPAQGALAIQCRADDRALQTLLRPLDDRATRRAVEAERAFLEAMGGGCAAPVAAHALDQSGELTMNALVASTDGARVVRVRGSGAEPAELALRLARAAAAQGALEFLH